MLFVFNYAEWFIWYFQRAFGRKWSACLRWMLQNGTTNITLAIKNSTNDGKCRRQAFRLANRNRNLSCGKPKNFWQRSSRTCRSFEKLNHLQRFEKLYPSLLASERSKIKNRRMQKDRLRIILIRKPSVWKLIEK